MPSGFSTRRLVAPDDVRLWIGLLGEQLGGDDPGRIAHPLDLDVRVVLVEASGVLLEVVGLDGGVDRQGRLRGADAGRREPDRRRDDQQYARSD